MSDYLTPSTMIVAGLAYLTACGVAGCYVSAQRNRSCGEGFLLAAIFGPMGLIVAACLPELPAVEDEAEEDSKTAQRAEDDAGRSYLAAMERVSRPNSPPPLRKLMGEVER